MTDSAVDPSHRSRAPRRRAWWSGGSTVRAWNGELLGWSVIGLGAGMLLGAWLGMLFGGVWGQAALWAALLTPVFLAFRRGIPRGLLALRPVDLLYGVVLGLVLRIMQGWSAVAFGGSGALPSYASLDGSLPALWWAEDLLAGGIVAPVIEELFFRGILLVALFSVVRRSARRASPDRRGAGIRRAGIVSVAVTTVLFVLTHQLVSALTPDAAVALTLLGIATGALVVLTGRIWPAVLVHIVFNLSGVGLIVAGTLLG